jgi:putative glutamine amidotransferase
MAQADGCPRISFGWPKSHSDDEGQQDIVIGHSSFVLRLSRYAIPHSEANVSAPLIGITGYRSLPYGPLAQFTFNLNESYIRAVQAASGLPVIISPILKEDELHGLFRRLDGLLFSGGGDIDPAIFGQVRHPATRGVSEERDRAELALARWALAEDKPMLAICRGIQVMNIAAGGTLIQDIPAQIPDAAAHTFSDDTPRDHIAHAVAVEAGARLAHILGGTRVTTNSWHHQSCQAPGQGIVYTAWAPDGVVEGAEAPGHRFAVGVQWHPEEMFHARADMLALFRALVEVSGK